MIATIPLLAAMLLANPQDSASSGAPPDAASASTPQNSGSLSVPQVYPVLPELGPEQQEERQQVIEEARARFAFMRKRANHINVLAGNIHSEADARAFVDAVTEELSGHRHLLWTALSIRHRVAHAEWEAVSGPSGRIPEQRVVEVWNEYVREIDAPEEALVTVAEVHNMRDAMYTISRRVAWIRDVGQSIWTIPNIYAVDSDGNVGDGCRAIEALRVIFDLHDRFVNVRAARDRVKQGIVMSDKMKAFVEKHTPRPTVSVSGPTGASGEFQVLSTPQDPIRPAVLRYQRERGIKTYNQLLRRLFQELFPEG